jgi:hypothetical protein
MSVCVCDVGSSLAAGLSTAVEVLPIFYKIQIWELISEWEQTVNDGDCTFPRNDAEPLLDYTA